MKVVVSIINFNTRDLTKKCLESILKRKWSEEIQVWVVDNASTDDSVEMIKKFSEVSLIENHENLGFGIGHNLVFKKVSGDYYLVLNSDCEMEDNVIDKMVEFMEKNPKCGISSCKLLGFNGELQPNAGDLPFGSALVSWLFNFDFLGGKSFHRNEPLYYENSHEVGWVSGSFMMIREEVVKLVGGFSKDYFMYFEDTEICYRAKKTGFKIMINPKVEIKHLSGGSLDNPRLRQWSGEYKGLIKFYGRFGKMAGFSIRLFIYISVLLRIIAYTLVGKFNISKTYGEVIANI